MQWRNTSTRYGLLSRAIHWGSALAVFGLFGLGLWMRSLDYYSEWYQRGPDLHKSIGVLLFAVLLLRLVWRFVSPPPAQPAAFSPLVKLAAHAMHGLLYFGLFAVMVSGYLISTADDRVLDVFGLFSLPSLLSFEQQEDIAGEIHEYGAWALVIFAVLHGLAALKHHFIDRDDTLRRMAGPAKD